MRLKSAFTFEKRRLQDVLCKFCSLMRLESAYKIRAVYNAVNIIKGYNSYGYNGYNITIATAFATARFGFNPEINSRKLTRSGLAAT